MQSRLTLRRTRFMVGSQPRCIKTLFRMYITHRTLVIRGKKPLFRKPRLNLNGSMAGILHLYTQFRILPFALQVIMAQAALRYFEAMITALTGGSFILIQ